MGLSLAALVVSVGSAVASNQNQKAAIREQRKATKIERRSAEISNIQARRDAVRVAMVKQAEIQAQAGVQGVSLSASRVSTGLSSLTTQLGAGISLQTNLEDLNTQRLKRLDSAASYGQKANDYAALSSLAMSVSSMSASNAGGGTSNGPKPITNSDGITLPVPFAK